MKKRVRIPKNAAKIVSLAKMVKDKHLADGDASVLNILNWKELTPVIDEAVTLQEQTDKLKRDLLESYQKRDLRVDTVVKFLRKSRDILTGMHDTEMKTLGQWGYDVLDARTEKAAVPPVAPQPVSINQQNG